MSFSDHFKNTFSSSQTPSLQEQDSYEMTVIVLYDGSSDSPQTPQAVNVVIVVSDVNDNSPQFLRKIIPMVGWNDWNSPHYCN